MPTLENNLASKNCPDFTTQSTSDNDRRRRQKMKQALVIHPIMDFLAGGEFLCLHVCKTLQELDYNVTLASETFDPSALERMYGMGRVMENCSHIRIPKFKPANRRFQSAQRLLYSRRIWPMFLDIDASVVFSTQSSPFFVRAPKLFHFVYSANDLFGYPPEASPFVKYASKHSFKAPYYLLYQQIKENFWRKHYSRPSQFFAIGSRVLADLRQHGYRNSSLLFPPCRTTFSPRLPKKKRVIQVARVIPDKKLELFAKIAEKLPEYEFLLIGRDLTLVKNSYPRGYSESVLASMPSNVTYVESPLRARPELLEESRVFLYTGSEPGIVLSVVEGIAAGCIPLSPKGVGAADIIEASGEGFTYSTIEDAVGKIRKILETNYTEQEIYRISKKANLFAPKVFENHIKEAVSGSPINARKTFQ